MLEPAARDDLGNLLHDAEETLDAAIVAASSLLAAVANLGAGAASPVGKAKSLSRMASMQEMLASARLKITGVHGDLAKIAMGSKDLPTSCPCWGAVANDQANRKAA